MKQDIAELLIAQHSQPVHTNMAIPRLVETAVCVARVS